MTHLERKDYSIKPKICRVLLQGQIQTDRKLKLHRFSLSMRISALISLDVSRGVSRLQIHGEVQVLFITQE